MRPRNVRWCLIMLVLALAASGACDSTRSVDHGDGSVPGPDAGQPAPCAAPTQVSDAAALVGLLGALDYQSVGPYSSTVLSASGDVQVTGTVVLSGKDLGAPPCSSYGCRPRISFVLGRAIAGLRCLTPESIAWFQGCAEVELSEATVRFRAVTRDTHPGEYNFTPVIEIVPACAAPCGAAELRCAATNLCFADYASYCRLCLALGNEVCPCQTAAGPAADGTACSFAVSGDVMCGGRCAQGSCAYEGKPGWAGCP